MNVKPDRTPPTCPLWSIPRYFRCLRWILLGSVLALMLLGQALANNLKYGIGSWEAPSGLPEQMWSQVDYDSSLTDPFFTSHEWSYPWWIIKHPDGHFESTRGFDESPVIEPPRMMHTARCFSTSFGTKHLVHLCEARLLDDNVIDLLIHVKNPAFRDSLRVRIRNGKFTCQYWIVDHKGAFTWTTTRQKLILDRDAYGKGDVIKGRIDFECAMKVIDPKDIERWGKDPSTTVKVFGVFKTVVE
jgi:hypothetical protein